MKSILFIRNMNDEASVEKIKEALENTRVEFTIALDRKAIVIEGSKDIIRAAKVTLNEAGFVVE